ncbi:hypothetical protein [Thiomicrorhabdus xiamenensis]|uniref:Outer membrane protein beta-barrel domain-containing protein n=1 Tax=Thiomicrorhabdus xiamenensis TaxID=2739063 RepID=A0A7D4P5Z6_9GAMM|nr:hypothetical protein [Thiomicrorhabdus xiamenensis]QKI90075.1 hypothetical protein HQN79_11055 [Thiomicrorhabdus xiamenensis]
MRHSPGHTKVYVAKRFKVKHLFYGFLLALSAFPARAEVQIGPALQYFHLEERNSDGHFLDSEKGFLPTIGLSVQTENLIVNASFAQADIDYSGQLQNGTPYSTDTATTLFDIALFYKLPVVRQAGYALHAGMGFAFWKRDITSSREDVLPLYEEYRNPYLSLSARIPLKDMTLNLGIKHHFNAEMALEIPDTGSADLDLPDSNELIVGLNYNIAPQWTLFSQYSYQLVSRSQTFPLKNNVGEIIGLAREPEHDLQKLIIGVKYGFE